MSKPARINLTALTRWITVAATLHGDALPQHLMQRLGISRRSAGDWLSKLVAAQWLVAEGTPRRPRYRPGPLQQVVQQLALQDLDEGRLWRREFAPYFELPAEVHRIAQHAFTELVNNAVDHSGGTAVTVSMRCTPLQLQLLVSDDGCGLFDRIAQSFAIDDAQLAMLELAKGKLTSQPERHLGHGLFFTSRLADVFDLHANTHAFQRRGWEPDRWRSTRPAATGGTSVYFAIALDSPRTLDSVLREHSLDGAGYALQRTRVPLALAHGAQAGLVSRADARRVGQRLGDFARAELDFSGVPEIGHSFADELLRVIGRRHPALQLVPMGMTPQVAAMVASVAG